MEQNVVPSIIICNTIMLALASVGLLVKLSMLGHSHYLGIDGVFCVISWIFAFVLCFTAIWMTRFGYGKHIIVVEADTHAISMFLKLIVVAAVSYLISLTAIKISFCLLYKRLFSVTHVGWVYWLIIGVVSCQFIEELFVFIFQCSPVRKLVDGTGTVQGRCLDLYVFYFVSFATRLATDIAIFMLPIPKLMKLQMSPGIKMGLILLFGLGLLVCVTSIIRATYLRRFQVDYTWDLVHALNWSAVEVCTAIFIACIPSFKAFVTLCSPKLRKRMGFSSGSRPHQCPNEESPVNIQADYFNMVPIRRSPGTPECFRLPSPFVEDKDVSSFKMSGAKLIVSENPAAQSSPEQDSGSGSTPGK